MMQKSVYTKLLLHFEAAKAERDKVVKNKPPSGVVQMLVVTEKQFASIECVVGTSSSVSLNSTDRLVVL